MTHPLRLETLALSLLLVSASPPAWAQWAVDGIPVTTAPGPQHYPAMAPDGQGGVFIAWMDANTPYSIFMQRVGPDGRTATGWPTGGLLIGSGCFDTAPRMTSDGTGGVYITCCGSSPAGSYLLRVTGSGANAAGWPVGGLHLPFVHSPYVVRPLSDGAGGLFLNWSHRYSYRDGDGFLRNRTDLYFQRLTSSGAIAPGWSANGTVVAWSDLYFDDLSVHPDGQGGILFACTLARVYGPANVFDSVLGRLDGGATMSYIVSLGCATDAESGRVHYLHADGSGGAIVGFDEFTGSFLVFIQDTQMRFNEYGQHLNGWAPDCQPFFPATALIPPRIVRDGGAGVFFAWQDTRNSTDADVFAMRLSEGGTPTVGWSSAGDAVCAAPGVQGSGLQMIPDGMGGAILAWSDQRNAAQSGPDIFAQRIGPDGPYIPGWPPTGLPVCTAPNWQQGVLLAPDEAGGAFVCWEDYRSGSADIYLHRLGADGPVPVQVSLVGARVEAGRVRVEWHLGDPFAGSVFVQRREVEGDWSRQGSASPDGIGRIHHEDQGVRSGGRYGYRLELQDGSDVTFAGDVWVDVPSLAFRLGSLTPNPSARGWTVSLSLLGGARATLEVLDVLGRVVMTREVGSLGAGQHQVPMMVATPLPAGVYTLRLTEAGRIATARGVIIR